MAKDGARPFSYLVRCVRNRAIELWRLERGIRLRHERATGDAALAPEATVNPIDDALAESEELAVAIAELGRLPIALKSLDREDLLLLFLSAVLGLHRDRIGDVLGTTANTAGQRLRRLRDRLYALLHDGRARAPDPGRARSGKASARKRAASRNGHEAPVDSAAEGDVRHIPDAPPFSGEDPQPVEGGDEES
jgi:DNA-directed RNA polymerase specialized sigma24 family protein